MPELPELETIARGLAPRLPGHTIERVTIRRSDMLAPPLRAAEVRRRLAGRRFVSVGRRGKNILSVFDDGLRMLINLGMTGRLVMSDAAAARDLRHVALRFFLDDGAALLFDDARRFGRVELHDAASWAARDATIGVEPLSDAFTAERMFELTSASATPIRNWLLDQRRVAGVGNIYAAEALWRARVHPARPANSLTREEAGALRDGVAGVLREAVDHRGTTFRDYRDASGDAGGFQFRLAVYDRAGQPCPRCGTPIERMVMSNRSAFFCPECQPPG